MISSCNNLILQGLNLFWGQKVQGSPMTLNFRRHREISGNSSPMLHKQSLFHLLQHPLPSRDRQVLLDSLVHKIGERNPANIRKLPTRSKAWMPAIRYFFFGQFFQLFLISAAEIEGHRGTLNLLALTRTFQ